MSNTALPRFGDPKLDDLINRLEIALSNIEGAPLAGAIILPPITVGTSDTRVYHGLGRPALGFWIVQTAIDIRVAQSLTPDATDPRNYFILRASTSGTVTLAVF